MTSLRFDGYIDPPYSLFTTMIASADYVVRKRCLSINLMD